MLFQNEKYISCIYKFTLDLFKLIEQNNNQIQNFEFQNGKENETGTKAAL